MSESVSTQEIISNIAVIEGRAPPWLGSFCVGVADSSQSSLKQSSMFLNSTSIVSDGIRQ